MTPTTKQSTGLRKPHLIRFRKMRKGPEADLVEHLIAYQEWIPLSSSARLVYLIEPQIGIGFPDLVLAVFDPQKIRRRNIRLELRDLRLIQYLSSRGKPTNTTDMQRALGIPAAQFRRSLSRISAMGIVQLLDDQVTFANGEPLFFLDQIIAIEAKVKNWRDALRQAELNQLFASASYVMLPEKVALTAREGFASSGSPGLLAPSNGNIECMKDASIHPLPQSVYSWMVNEMVRKAMSEAVGEKMCHA